MDAPPTPPLKGVDGPPITSKRPAPPTTRARPASRRAAPTCVGPARKTRVAARPEPTPAPCDGAIKVAGSKTVSPKTGRATRIEELKTPITPTRSVAAALAGPPPARPSPPPRPPLHSAPRPPRRAALGARVAPPLARATARAGPSPTPPFDGRGPPARPRPSGRPGPAPRRPPPRPERLGDLVALTPRAWRPPPSVARGSAPMVATGPVCGANNARPA